MPPLESVAEDAEKDDKKLPRSKVVAAAREEDARDVLEWVASQSPDASFRIRVERKRPMTGPNGENIVGALDTIEERPENLTEYIRERWGGGSFALKVEIPSKTGGWQYAKATTIQISGDPKLESRLHPGGRSEAVAAPVRDTLAERAFGSAERLADQERSRADRLERELRESRAQGPDMTLVNALMGRLEALNARVLEMATKDPPKDEFRDTILKQAVGGESQRVQDLQRMYEARLDKMRDDHAAELRQIRTSHDDTTRRAEDRHDKAMDATQKTHERTVADLTKVHDRALEDLRRAHERETKQSEKSESTSQKTLEAAHQARIDALGAENKRLAGDNAELKSQIGALRLVKEKSPSEQLKDLAGIKENLDALTGGGGGDEDKPWYAQLAEVVGNSEAAISIIERIGGKKADEAGAPAQQAPQQVQHPPVGALVRNPADNRMYRHIGNGQYQGPIDEAKLKALLKARAKKQVAAAQAQAGADDAQGGEEDAIDAAMAEVEGGIDNGIPRAMPNPKPVPAITAKATPQPMQVGKPAKPPSPEDVKNAVLFMESCFTGKQDPGNVARTAKTMMSGSTLQHIAHIGPDRFLEAVSQVKPGSPLVTQLGRTFVRQVAAHLFGDAT